MRKLAVALAAVCLSIGSAADALVLNLFGTITSGSTFQYVNGVGTPTDLTGQNFAIALDFTDTVFNGVTYTSANYDAQPVNDAAVLGVIDFTPVPGGVQLDAVSYDAGHFFDDVRFLNIFFAGTNIFADPNDYNSFQPQNVDFANSTLSASHDQNVFLPGPNGVDTSEFGYQFNGTLTALNATPVPEPASWALMIAGFGAIGGLRRRRVRRASLLAA